MKWEEKELRKCISDNCNVLIKGKGEERIMFSKVKFWDSYCEEVIREELETYTSKADLKGGPKSCQTTSHVVEKSS